MIISLCHSPKCTGRGLDVKLNTGLFQNPRFNLFVMHPQ